MAKKKQQPTQDRQGLLENLRVNLRLRRTALGLSQEELARKVEISVRTYSGYEQIAKTFPATDVSLALARELGCRVEDLFLEPAIDPLPPA